MSLLDVRHVTSKFTEEDQNKHKDVEKKNLNQRDYFSDVH